MSDDDSYRDSYRDISVHKMMLMDVVRTEAYERALRQMVKPGHKVLDFGCGTAVLSMFAARFGADTVYAVDRSAFITAARAIAMANHIENIRFYHDDHTSLVLPEPVDVLVSEWMGHFIFHEAMLEPLVFLRNRYLRPGGVMIPDQIRFIAGFVTDESFYEELCFFRQNPYGIDFSPVAEAPLYQTNLEFFTPSQISKTLVDLGSMDLYVVDATPEVLEGAARPKRKETVYGLAGWFSARLTPNICLETGPNDPPTHWNQMFFPFKEPLTLDPAREVTVRIRPPKPIGKGEDTWSWTVTDGSTLIQMDDEYPFDPIATVGLLGA
jgi:type I protein arginine methyltransferase